MPETMHKKGKKMKITKARSLFIASLFAICVPAHVLAQDAAELGEATIETPPDAIVDAGRMEVREVTSLFLADLREARGELNVSQEMYARCHQRAAKQAGAEAETEKSACEYDASDRNIGHYEKMQVIFGEASTNFYAQAEKLSFEVRQHEAEIAKTIAAILDHEATRDQRLASFREVFVAIDADARSEEEEGQMRDVLRDVQMLDIKLASLNQERRTLDIKASFKGTLVGRMREWGFNLNHTGKDFDINIADEELRMQAIQDGAEVAALTDRANGVPGDFEAITAVLSEINNFVAEPRPEPTQPRADATVGLSLPSPPASSAYEALADLYKKELTQ